jgi:hypothetical protein
MTYTEIDITREHLKLHNIFYHEYAHIDRSNSQAHGTSQAKAIILPDHVDTVRQALLTFVNLIPPVWQPDLNEELREHRLESAGLDLSLQPPPEAFIRSKNYELWDPSEKSFVAHEKLKSHERLAKAARKMMHEGNTGWRSFWKEDVFKRYNEEFYGRPGYR